MSFLVLCAMICPDQSLAGVLTIQTRTDTVVKGQMLDVTITITNKGNEPARNTQISITVPGKTMEGQITSQLDPGKSDVGVFTHNLSGISWGRYPLVVTVIFYDANLYPFSAISGSTFYWGKDVNSDIAITSIPLSIDRDGTLVFDLKNLGADAHDITASLFLPKEFSAATSSIACHLNARAEKKLIFDIANFSARNDATYPAFAFYEYQQNNVHFTAMASAMMTVKTSEGWFRHFKWVWMSTIGILLVILGILYLKPIFRSVNHS